jgi:hypothetical protein
MSEVPTNQPIASCSGCGASIFREHLDRQLAGRYAGQLYCRHCLAEKQGVDLESLAEADRTPTGDRSAASTAGGYAGFGDDMNFDAQPFKRPLLSAGHGATRVRIWHCKMASGPVSHMNAQINEWLDNHPDIEIKFANTTVGTWEGKHSEPNLILSLFY